MHVTTLASAFGERSLYLLASCSPASWYRHRLCAARSYSPAVLTTSSFVFCRVEFLTHDISVHVPHHVASKIPWYNLRMANDSLRQNWGQVTFALFLHAVHVSL